jgi:hypothetical protein
MQSRFIFKRNLSVSYAPRMAPFLFALLAWVAGASEGRALCGDNPGEIGGDCGNGGRGVDYGAATGAAVQGLQFLDKFFSSKNRDNSSAYCDNLSREYRYLQNEMRVPPQYSRFLRNRTLSVFGDIRDPESACSDVDVYRNIRRRTNFVARALIVDCNQRFTGGTNSSNIDLRIADEEASISQSARRICNLARSKLNEAADADQNCLKPSYSSEKHCINNDSVTVQILNKCRTTKRIEICLFYRNGRKTCGSDEARPGHVVSLWACKASGAYTVNKKLYRQYRYTEELVTCQDKDTGLRVRCNY